MGIENVLDSSAEIGRKAISYIANDPAGCASLIAGYELADKSPALSIPFFAFGVWHIPHTIKMRKNLDREVKENGLNEKVINKFNKPSWCSHRVAIAYAFSKGKYGEFKELLNKYSYKHYAKRLVLNLKNKIKSLL